MSNSQTFKVETIYSARDESSKAIGEIAKHAREASEHIRGLRESLKHVGEAVGVYEMWHKAKEYLFDYNKELENSKVKIAGMLTMYTGAPVAASFDRAAISVDRFQQMAKKSSLTTKDLVDTAGALTGPLMMAGIKMGDIEKMTFGVANLAKASGENSMFASRQVQEALTEGIHVTNQFAQSLIREKEINLTNAQFNALSQQKKVDVINKSLTSKSVTDLIAMHGEQTLSGVFSTLEDNIQITLGKVGIPIFKAITNEIKDWNAWFDKNQKKLDEIGKVVGEKLVEGFHALKSVFEFIYDHAGTLLKIGEVYAAIKIGSIVGSGIGGSAMSAAVQAGGIGNIFGGFFRANSGTGDSFGPNGYEANVNNAGRGFSPVGGLKGALGSANLLAMSAAAGVAIGTLITHFTNLDEALTNTMTVHGDVIDMSDKTSREYAQVVHSMDVFDTAIEKATQRLNGLAGANGTTGVAQLKGLGDAYADQVVAIEEATEALKHLGSGKMGMGVAEGILAKAGLTTADMAGIVRRGPGASEDALNQKVRDLNYRAEGAAYGANEAWKDLPEDVRKVVESMGATSKVMEAFVAAEKQRMPDVKYQGQGMNAGVNLHDASDIVKNVLGEEFDNKYRATARVNQNISVHIEQVSAKDPNRWIAEMEDFAKQKLRAKTRAKNGWGTSTK